MRNLIYTGGWAHPFERTAPVVADVLAPAGVTTQITDCLSTVRRALDLGTFDLFTVYACRFSMLDARYTDEQRDEFAERISADTRDAIEAHTRRGGAVLALHTATSRDEPSSRREAAHCRARTEQRSAARESPSALQTVVPGAAPSSRAR